MCIKACLYIFISNGYHCYHWDERRLHLSERLITASWGCLDDDVELFFEHPYQETRVRAVWKHSFARKSMVSGKPRWETGSQLFRPSVYLWHRSPPIYKKDGVCELPAERGIVGLIKMFHSKYAQTSTFILTFIFWIHLSVNSNFTILFSWSQPPLAKP